ncbi:MAG: NmrA family protein [Candidatus Saccharibacteria bacterium]|nr:NmrA family protein [Candidatus Saccharibacteria bacterium]
MGRLVVSELIAGGYSVVAFVHSSNPFEGLAGVRVVRGDITDATQVSEALRGSEAVISTLGSWGTKSKDIVATGAKSITEAMQASGAKRIITLTGGSALVPGEKVGFMASAQRRLLSLVAGKILSDGEKHLAILAMSGLDWTCIRAPAMSGSGSVVYQLSMRLPSLLASIPRVAVARSLVDQLSSREFIGQAPVITKL